MVSGAVHGYSLWGQIVGIWGRKGRIKLRLFCTGDDFRQDLLYLSVDDVFVPYAVLFQQRLSKAQTVLALDGVDSQEKASLFVGRSLYISVDSSLSHAGQGSTKLRARHVEGFRLYDGNKEIGQVISVSEEIRENPLLRVRVGEKEVLVPFALEGIQKVDTQRKVLYMNLPEGLLEMNEGCLG
ncbi:MAG: hypothetical protein OXB93_05825 [Cytophagales bacterium]|nr:hypothetical protein [Cytophagales bacterium]